MMMMMTSLRRRWSRQVGQSSNRRCQPSRQAHVKPPFWQIKYLLAFLLSFLSGYDDLAMHIGNTLFHNFCNLLFLLGPGLAFGWLGLGGSSGGYSSHGYTSHASLGAYGAKLGGDSSSSEDLQNIFDIICFKQGQWTIIDTFEQYLKFQYTSFTSFTSYPPRINQTLTPPHHISNAPSQNN